MASDSHASTFGGNPVSCMAALSTIDLIEVGLLENAAVKGKRLKDGLVKPQQSHECMKDVREKGLMVAVDVVKYPKTKEPARTWRDNITKHAFQKELLLLGCGENSILFCPSLTVKTKEVGKCLFIYDEVAREVAV